MLVELTCMEINSVSGGNNDEIYKQVDLWIRNNPNSHGQHWEPHYTYDSNWNITSVVMQEVEDVAFA